MLERTVLIEFTYSRDIIIELPLISCKLAIDWFLERCNTPRPDGISRVRPNPLSFIKKRPMVIVNLCACKCVRVVDTAGVANYVVNKTEVVGEVNELYYISAQLSSINN